MALNVGLPHIPDLVMCQIIRLLPTKDVVRMSFLSKQWEDVLSSVPVLDFDECGERRPHNFDPDNYQQQQQQQHVKFIDNILTKYLELYEKDKHKESLEKFRLRMMYSSSDTAIVDKLLNNSFDRGVKELEISLRVSKSNWNRAHAASYHCFCLSPTTLANAKSLTTLKLEYMRIKESLKCDEMKLPESDTPLLPSLKIMSFKNVHFNFLYSLIRECPSIEHLSLISCSFDKAIVFVSTSSLKSLEAKYCKAGFLHVQDDAKTLESLTFVSTRMRCIMLGNTHNLRHINIHSRQLKVQNFYESSMFITRYDRP
ncbi:putative F-box/FBD/LRR-repeat protein At5g44960 [Argentina anserina]|uniref:putative F-box/FBD/LRR-repeat protein At5g44960 n=1 Tax=Argentina anserina TaxID=57926 RepID=UPI00217694E4|nr:putative F-box/FBD/LRR-repeat protein At5g44960 [Potentilla anserina]